ncbi:uncharacterized protein EV422DRAFT_119290 [Fimicolochytrium jonesii]|uniref:uncharacterized protein n=1 Tax=Fimicolochytrium jonesii TaxID=1396493 RepID=UPI0022FF2705|nr:uncharacterized protein EV422DRAFT_119290 [Fimicolochytrium jonesii]KAI8819141.1 hypothetical protein EV422DRAFT_119290 [Fimicolochytrium jonesii]
MGPKLGAQCAPNSKLPLELIPEILRFSKTAELHKMIFVCRDWHDCLLKCLYSTIVIRSERQVHLLFTTLTTDMERFRWIKSFNVIPFRGVYSFEAWTPPAFAKITTLVTMSRPDELDLNFHSLATAIDRDDYVYTFGWNNGELVLSSLGQPDRFQEEVLQLAQAVCWIYADQTTSLKSLGGTFRNLPPFKALRIVTLVCDRLIGYSENKAGRQWGPRTVHTLRMLLDTDESRSFVDRTPRWTRSLDIEFNRHPMKLPPWDASTRIHSRVLRYAPPRVEPWRFSFDRMISDWRAELDSYNGGGALEIMVYQAVRWNNYPKSIDMYVQLATESGKFEEVRRVQMPADKYTLLEMEPLPVLDVEYTDDEPDPGPYYCHYR